MAAMDSEDDGVIYAIAVVGSCNGEAKTWDLKCVFLFVTPSQKKERSRRWNARVYSTYFCNLGIKIIKVQCVGKLQVEGSYEEIKYPETSQVF